jgi:hypothetical protein
MFLEIETWLNLMANNECIDTLNVLHVENVECHLFWSSWCVVLNSIRSLLFCVEHVYSCEGIRNAEFYSPEWKSNQGYVFSS